MKVIVLYDSVFGNTEKVAFSMAAALAEQAVIKRIGDATAGDLEGADLLVVGSPTRGFRPTEGVKLFLDSLKPGALTGISAAAFDTRIPPETIESKFFRKVVVMGGYADRKISKLLQAKGARLLESAGFYVAATEGPVVEGEIERAVRWIKAITATAKA